MKIKLNMPQGWPTRSSGLIRVNFLALAFSGSLAAQVGLPTAAAPLKEASKAVAVREGESAAPETRPSPAPKELVEILRVQIFLDKVWFSPGRLDGVVGPATERAVRNFNGTHGVDGLVWGKVLADAAKEVPRATIKHTVKKGDWHYVTAGLPAKPEEQAKTKYMGYRTMLEMIMERYHCTLPVLEKLNPGVGFGNLKTGSTVTVPNVTPFLIESFETVHKYEADPVLSARKVEVDTKARMARVYANGKLVAAFPIVPGKDKFIHRGKWKLLNMVTNPTFTYDKSFLTTGKRSSKTLTLPPGPNNPVGVLWAGTSKSGIGLHGTSSPEIMNYARSSGCVRLANWDIARLHEIVRPGCEVEIR